MSDGLEPADDLAAVLRQRADLVTPARVFAGAAGTSYRTSLLLGLRADHAAARDAVAAKLDLDAAYLKELAARYQLIVATSSATSHEHHLTDPRAGRRLSDASRLVVGQQGSPGSDLQVILGDGLSATAVAANGADLLSALVERARAAGLRVGRPVLVRYCRVGILNDIGALLRPAAAVVLIGERPGLRVADSLSAYLAYRPNPGQTDADRNVVSNIHARGTGVDDAVTDVVALLERMRAAGGSGVALGREP
jgi:ethanolamine ammonia-lyase small subunit